MIDIQDLEHLRSILGALRQEGRYAELLDVIGVPTLQYLNIEAAKARLSRLVFTQDFRILLPDYDKEVELSPIPKALYILFLKHPEGIEFKHLIDHKEELINIYSEISNRISQKTIDESISRLVNPLDNSINEKCARIKSAFASLMDEYQLNYYAISSHTTRRISGSSHIWFERKKTITLPRELVSFEQE